MTITQTHLDSIAHLLDTDAREAAHARGVLRTLQRRFGAGEFVAGFDAGEVALEAADLEQLRRELDLRPIARAPERDAHQLTVEAREEQLPAVAAPKPSRRLVLVTIGGIRRQESFSQQGIVNFTAGAGGLQGDDTSGRSGSGRSRL